MTANSIIPTFLSALYLVDFRAGNWAFGAVRTSSRVSKSTDEVADAEADTAVSSLP
jgi:hypothetical protein